MKKKLIHYGVSFAVLCSLLLVFGGCSLPTDDTTSVARSVNKFVAESDRSNNLGDRIKYSVTFGDCDFYYIYLGEMKNIPLYSFPTESHNGMSSSYSVTVNETTKEYTERIVSDERQLTLSVVDNYTISSTTGGKFSLGFNGKLGGDPYGGSVGLGFTIEDYWGEIESGTIGGGTQRTTSLTDTVKYGTEYTNSDLRSRTWNLTKNDKAGYYRYTLFSASDVYLYIIRDRSKPDELFYEFREHVKQGVKFWELDYSANPSFSKTDESRFEFDLAMLDELRNPENYIPEYDITQLSVLTFNSNGGSQVPDQTILLHGTAVKPANPTRNGFAFDGWYSDPELKNLYNFATPVIGILTLHAKWYEIHTVSFNANGGSGTLPFAQTATVGSSITLPNGTGLSRSEHALIGWNTNDLGTGTYYSAGSSYTPMGDVTLFAVWTRTVFSKEAKSRNFTLGDRAELWDILSPVDVKFDIQKLRSAGYTHFKISLGYKAKQTFLLAIEARLWVEIRNRNGDQYISTVFVPAKSWKDYSLNGTVSLDNFDNSLSVRWADGSGGTVEVGDRVIKIEASK